MLGAPCNPTIIPPRPPSASSFPSLHFLPTTLLSPAAFPVLFHYLGNKGKMSSNPSQNTACKQTDTKTGGFAWDPSTAPPVLHMRLCGADGNNAALTSPSLGILSNGWEQPANPGTPRRRCCSRWAWFLSYFGSGTGVALSLCSQHYPHPAQGSVPGAFLAVARAEVAKTIHWLQAAICSTGGGPDPAPPGWWDLPSCPEPWSCPWAPACWERSG